MLPIWLPTLIHTDATLAARDMGMEEDITECDIKNVLFYNIAGITAYNKDGDLNTYSILYANGTDFLINMPCNKLKDLIDG